MKVGMPLLYELKSVEENIELAKKLNLDFVELNLNYPYCRIALENWEVLKQKLDEYDLSTTLHFFDDFDFFGPSEVVDTYISLFKKYVELAGKCNLKIVNFSFFFRAPPFSIGSQETQFLAECRGRAFAKDEL